MMVWLGGLALATLAAVRSGAPADRWWPWILLFFWLCGIAGNWYALKLEVAVVTVIAPSAIVLRRGPAFGRTEHRLNQADLHVETCTDSDGDPYFKLMMAAPGGPVALAEGHYRERLDEMADRIREAVGSPHR